MKQPALSVLTSDIDRVRDELDDHLKIETKDSIWATLVEYRYVGQYLDEGDLSALAAVYDGIEAHESRTRARQGPTPPANLEPDRRNEALSRIVAHHASLNESVVSFRAEYLPDGLISVEEVAEWVDTKALADGPPTVWIKAPTLDGTSPSTPIPEIRFAVESFELPREFSSERLDVPFGEPRRIRYGGVLYRLKQVASYRNLPVFPDERSRLTFVLTGTPPKYPMATVAYSRLSAEETLVTITANIRTAPGEVAKLFQEARENRKGANYRSKEIAERNAQLAVFVSEKNGSGLWRQLCFEWNRLHPDWEFENEIKFGKASRLAYKRVTGRDLEWKGST